MLPHRVSLMSRLPPNPEVQLRNGACTAHAVVALLEYHADCRVRLSVAFLFAAMRLQVQAWMERNLLAAMRGERGEADFESLFRENIAGLRGVVASNGQDSVASRRFMELFRERVVSTFGVETGCPIRFASEALMAYGICRHALWPEGGVSQAMTFSGVNPVLPDAVREEARRRRMANGLDFLPEPGNVEAIKGVLAGKGERRPMPVVAALDAYPDGRGAHSVLVVGYRDDKSSPGGGFFWVRDGSGARCARLAYAYLAAHCTEAATILQGWVDYAGDGYDGFRRRRRVRMALGGLAIVALFALGVFGWRAWRLSPSVVDAPFDWLADSTMEPERISICGDVTYGSCLSSPDSIKRYFFREEDFGRAVVNFSSNGVATAVASHPDVLMLFARSTDKCCSAADKKALDGYLSGGGTVFAFVCDCNRVLMADLLVPYGLRLQSLPGKPPIRAVAPVLREGQLDGFSYFRVTEMTSDWHPMVVTEGMEAPVMAFRRFGKGKIFCVAQQLFGSLGQNRTKNANWWERLLLACVSDSVVSSTETD